MFIRKVLAPLVTKVRAHRQISLFETPFFPFWLCQVAPDRSLQSPFAPRVASPESCSEDAYWQEEAQLTWDDAAFSNLTPPAPASPDRNSRQPRSSGGKLAYVVFGDQTTGVYYNWYVFFILLITFETHAMMRVACNHKLNHYAQASFQKPRFLGYASYEEAESAWAFYLETRIIPHPPADGGVSATPVPLAQPTTPQRNRGRYYNLQGSPIPAVSSRPPHYPLIPAHRGSPTPVRGASSPARSNVTSPPPLYAQLPPLSQPRTLTVARRAEEASFFVVIVGYNPGVYAAR